MPTDAAGHQTRAEGPGPAWRDEDLRANPHAAADKASRVRRMFAAIAPSYDLNNRLHSFGRDQAWRRAAVKMAELKRGDVVVDVACGTGDLTQAFHRRGLARRVLGIDFTTPMLHVAVSKRRSSPMKDASSTLSYHAGDATRLPLPDACCDVVSIAFGLRNVADPGRAMAEFHRVLRPGGRVVVLEFSRPTNPLLRRLNDFYCGTIMPRTATWIARDRSGAYKYLPSSVNTFLGREETLQLIRDAGFRDTVLKPLTFGVAVIYLSLIHI